MERLTKKLVYDMNHPPSEDFFGTFHAPLHYYKSSFSSSFFFFFSIKLTPTLSVSTSSGRCARCGDNVVGDGSGCIAMEQVFHVECFTCITCHAHLRGQPFYALDKKSYCESCYIVSIWTSARSHSLPAAVLSTPPVSSRVRWSAVQSAPNPSWTGSCEQWGRPTTLAASRAWSATAVWMVSPSPWTPPPRSTA